MSSATRSTGEAAEESAAAGAGRGFAARARNALRAGWAVEDPVSAGGADDDGAEDDGAVVDTAAAETPVEDAPVIDDAVEADADVAADADTEDIAVEDIAVEADAEDEPTSGRPARWLGPTTVCAIIAGLALVFVVIAGTLWWTTDHGSALKAANARDKVLFAARLDIATLNSLDYQHVETGLKNWLSVTTGPMHDQLIQAQQSATQTIAEAKMVTTASVLSAAVTALDAGKGTATVIASVNVTKKPVTGAAVVTRNRYSASMQLVHGTWKVSDLTMVAVQLS